MVRQHDAACADADCLRARRNVRNHQRGCRRGHGRHVVMLGHPEPLVAKRFRVLGKAPRCIQRIGARKTFPHPPQFKNGKSCHVLGLRMQRN